MSQESQSEVARLKQQIMQNSDATLKQQLSTPAYNNPHFDVSGFQRDLTHYDVQQNGLDRTLNQNHRRHAIVGGNFDPKRQDHSLTESIADAPTDARA